MSLKFKYKAKEEVPAEAQSLYVEREGAFVLDVEGAVDKARVEEVRASNVALSHQLAEQKRRFEAIESDQVKAIAAERDALNGRLMAIQVDQGRHDGGDEEGSATVCDSGHYGGGAECVQVGARGPFRNPFWFQRRAVRALQISGGVVARC